MLKPFLELGRIVGTHGVRGELRVQPWCDTPSFLCKFSTVYLGIEKKAFHVLSARPHKNIALVRLEGINTVEQADRIRGTILYMDRKDAHLEPGVHFIQDLIGLHVINADSGKSYGILTDVMQTGANDVYEVTGEDGKTYLVPAIPSVIISLEPEEGVARIRPIEGIFDHAD